MWTEISKSILEFLKLAPRYLVAIMMICAALLFSPQSLQETLGVTTFVNSHRQWIGLALVCSLGIWLVICTTSIYQWIISKWQTRQRKARITARLQNLTEPEKQILRYYIAKNTRGNKLNVQSGDVQALSRAGIIYQSASLGSLFDGFAHNITDFAWEYLHNNPHVLDGTTNTYYTDEQDDPW